MLGSVAGSQVSPGHTLYLELRLSIDNSEPNGKIRVSVDPVF